MLYIKDISYLFVCLDTDQIISEEERGRTYPKGTTMEMVMAQSSMTIHKENSTPWQDVTSTYSGKNRLYIWRKSVKSQAVHDQDPPTLLWKLKTVTEKHTSAVIPKHRTTDLVL